MNVYCLRSFGGVKLRFDLYKKVNFFPEFSCVMCLPKLHVKGPILSTVSRVCRERWSRVGTHGECRRGHLQVEGLEQARMAQSLGLRKDSQVGVIGLH